MKAASGLIILMTFIFAGCGEATDDDPVVVEKTYVDIAGQFDYSLDLPSGLAFDSYNFWVSAKSTSKLVAYDTLNGAMTTNWGLAEGSRGLHFHNDSLYLTGTEVSYHDEIYTIDIFLYSISVASSETKRLLSLRGQAPATYANLLVYEPSSSHFVVGLETARSDGPPTHKLWNFDPATGELISVLWEGRLSGVTVHEDAIWIAEEIAPNSEYKIRKLNAAGESQTVYDIVPTDGEKGTGGSVEGIAFVGDELWYLNGPMLRVVKSNITN